MINRPENWTARSWCILAISLFIISALSPAGFQNTLVTGKSTGPGQSASTPQSPSAFIVSPSTTSFSLRDELNYPSISAMVAAGWTRCGVSNSTYYSISHGVLTLVNDGVSSGVMCWGKIPTNVANWEVSTNTSYAGRNFSGGLNPAVTLIVLAGTHTYRAVSLGYLQLLRDDYELFSAPFNIVGPGVWHLIKMEMKNHVLTLLADGMAVGSYTEPDTDTHLVQIQLSPSWMANDSFDYVMASQVDPNAPGFQLGISPTNITILAGSNATYTISLASVNGFANKTTFTVHIVTDSNYSLTPLLSISTLTPKPGVLVSSTLTLSTYNVITAAVFQIVVNASSGSLSQVVLAILSVTILPPDFDFTISSGGPISITQNGDGSWPVRNVTLTLRSLWRFTGNITITTSSYFQGPAAFPTPSIVFLGPNDVKNVTLGVTAIGPGASGIFTISIMLATGSIQKSGGISVYYIPTYFSVTGGPTTLIVAPGSPAEFTLNFTSYNNFVGPISLTSTVSPSVPYSPTLSYAAMITINPNQSKLVKITVSVQDNTPRQNYQVAITARSAYWTGYANFQIVPMSRGYTPGVHLGTWASYNLEISLLQGYSFSANLTVIRVAGSNVTYTVDLYEDQAFVNSTIASNDVALGTLTNPIVPLFVIASNLTIGDPILPLRSQSPSIQTSSEQELAGATRLTNGLQTGTTNSQTAATATWDANTGILGSLYSTFYINSTLVTANYQLTATNAWKKQLALSIFFSKPSVSVPVTFTSNLSNGTPPYSYDWSFGDGQTSTQADPSHTYNHAGSYHVTLQVTDGSGSTASQTIVVNISATPRSLFQFPVVPWATILTMIERWLPFAIPVYSVTIFGLSLVLVRRQNRKRRSSWTE